MGKGDCIMNTLTPKQIVSELDKYIIGQSEAKKWLQLHLEADIEEDWSMKNFDRILFQKIF
jgi:ATP-dependent protease HslVU (ClpYQ) ATPase subunit